MPGCDRGDLIVTVNGASRRGRGRLRARDRQGQGGRRGPLAGAPRGRLHAGDAPPRLTKQAKGGRREPMTRGKTTTQTATNRERHRILKAMLEARRDEIQSKLRARRETLPAEVARGQGRRGAERPRLRAGRGAGADGDEVGDAGQDRRGHDPRWSRAPTAPAPSAARRSPRRGCRPCPSRRCAGTASSVRRTSAGRRTAATAPSTRSSLRPFRANVPRRRAEAARRTA